MKEKIINNILDMIWNTTLLISISNIIKIILLFFCIISDKYEVFYSNSAIIFILSILNIILLYKLRKNQKYYFIFFFVLLILFILMTIPIGINKEYSFHGKFSPEIIEITTANLYFTISNSYWISIGACIVYILLLNYSIEVKYLAVSIDLLIEFIFNINMIYDIYIPLCLSVFIIGSSYLLNKVYMEN